jgi:hypothetical protein
MIDPGEGYRLLREGEVIAAGDDFLSRLDSMWKPCQKFEIGGRFLAEEWQPVRRKKTPVDYSIYRLRTAMAQSPHWAAALLQDLPQELRNDIATVLTHFIGDTT